MAFSQPSLLSQSKVMPFHIRDILELLNFHGRIILDTTLTNVFDKAYEFFDYIRFSITLSFYFVWWQYDRTGLHPERHVFFILMCGVLGLHQCISHFSSLLPKLCHLFLVQRSQKKSFVNCIEVVIIVETVYLYKNNA